MPTPLNNQASIRYSYNNNTGTGAASSNTVTTNLLDRYTLSATKTPLSATFRPGENITYVLRLENNGSGDLYNVTVADNLGSGGAAARRRPWSTTPPRCGPMWAATWSH